MSNKNIATCFFYYFLIYHYLYTHHILLQCTSQRSASSFCPLCRHHALCQLHFIYKHTGANSALTDSCWVKEEDLLTPKQLYLCLFNLGPGIQNRTIDPLEWSASQKHLLPITRSIFYSVIDQVMINRPFRLQSETIWSCRRI